MTLDAALAAEIAKVNKKFPGALILGKDLDQTSLPRITSGSLALDVALGGGWPANQWGEIYGDETHGKTAIALKTVAANQALDPNWVCLWIAAEPFNAQYAEMCGCDLSRMVIIESNAHEFVFDQILNFAVQRLVDSVIIDSLPALVAESEDENAMDEWVVGLSARLNNKFFVRKQRTSFARSLTEEDRPITGLIINQFREKIGVLRGDPRTTPGGRGKNFAVFTRVEVRRDEWIEQGDDRVGQVIKARVVKNKSAPPQKVATLDFYFQDCRGHRAGEYDSVKEIVAVGIIYDVIKRAGAWFSYGAEKWNGRAPLVEQLYEDVGLRQQIGEEVLTIVRKGKGVIEAASEPIPEPTKAKKAVAPKSKSKPAPRRITKLVK